mgnify:CR=1 FL=1
MNYSVMPEETLLPEDNYETMDNRIEVEVEGLIMEIDATSGELLRIVSSNPGDYLLYQPGVKINFVPQI